MQMAFGKLVFTQVVLEHQLSTAMAPPPPPPPQAGPPPENPGSEVSPEG